jgi:hypothetical protein
VSFLDDVPGGKKWKYGVASEGRILMEGPAAGQLMEALLDFTRKWPRRWQKRYDERGSERVSQV